MIQHKTSLLFVAVSVMIACWPSAVTRAEPLATRFHYEKTEHLVEMRDGVPLFTAVYSPRESQEAQPILLMRTPYSIEPYGEDAFPENEVLAPGQEFLEEGYILVLQDVRGAYRSEGDWTDFRLPAESPGGSGVDEATDTWDTIEWLIENVPGNNGRVGRWGISYPAWYTMMSLLRQHRALKAVSPQATTADAFVGDDFHHNGAFILSSLIWAEQMTIGQEQRRSPWRSAPAIIDYETAWSCEFFLNAGRTDEINERFFDGRLYQLWTDFIEHPDYDEFWQARNFLELVGEVRIPVLNVGSWFDEYDMYGAFSTYRRIEDENSSNRSMLVSGPWRHGGWSGDDGSRLGDIAFGSATAEYYRLKIVFPFSSITSRTKANGRRQRPSSSRRAATAGTIWSTGRRQPRRARSTCGNTAACLSKRPLCRESKLTTVT